ncbi:MAG TPA: MBL fold metallo-hydrolase [Ilumatobacteraceae bacterium]|nr:MBL fold metallo-hydrolase [Ilumatobacteraceae bacterium]HUC32924.1 MBL fold metallo-hydrolase [Ilumatobacteraceae bacterium]
MERRTLGPHTTVLFGVDHGKYPDGNSVLVIGRDGTAVIDPSLSSRDEALDVDRIVLTHAHEDHVAGVSGVRHGELSVHHDDLAALRDHDDLMRLYGVPADQWPAMTAMVRERFHYDGWPSATGLADGDVIDLGGVTLRLIHAPGHTGGHSVVLVEPDGVLVCGDIDLTGFGPYYGDAASDLEAFEQTLGLVRTVEANHYVTFHHKGVVDGHAEFATAIDSYTASIQRRADALWALLEAPQTLDELQITGIVYRPGTRPPIFGDSVERFSIERHLARLLADGVVATDGEQYWRHDRVR